MNEGTFEPEDDLEFLEYITFSLLPMCGCGATEEILEMFRDALRHYRDNNTNDNPGRSLEQAIEAQRAYEKSFSDERLFWLVVYALDHAELMEHGCSVRVGWLTARGKRYLRLLEDNGCETNWQQRAAESAPS